MSSGIGQEPAEAPRKGEVWEQQTLLYERITNIRKLVGQLTDRLSPVLNSQQVGGAAEVAETPKEPSKPLLIKQLRANNSDLQSIEARLGSLMERLEL